jgi:hypothetical protein
MGHERVIVEVVTSHPDQLATGWTSTLSIDRDRAHAIAGGLAESSTWAWPEVAQAVNQPDGFYVRAVVIHDETDQTTSVYEYSTNQARIVH